MYYGHQPTCRRPILSPRRVIVIVAFDKDRGLTALMMDEVPSIDEQAVDRLIRHNITGCRLANQVLTLKTLLPSNSKRWSTGCGSANLTR